MPLTVLEALREAAPNVAGLKVSDTPWESFAAYLVDGLDVFVGPEAFITRGWGREPWARSRRSAPFPERVAAAVREPEARPPRRDRRSPELRRVVPTSRRAERVVARRGVPVRGDSAPALAAADRGRAPTGGSRAMAEIVVAGAGAVGASIAYHLALRGARDVVLADMGEIASGATGKAMGGVGEQFSTAPEVRLAQASVRLFQELGPPLFEQVGYLFLATTEEGW